MAQDSNGARGIWAFLAGVFAAQVANNALIVSLPLVLLNLGQSIATVGFVTTLTTGIDMSGALVSGWLTHYFSTETVLKQSTWTRCLALLLIPTLLTMGGLTLSTAVALYVVDALARGVADTARNTLPVALVGKSKEALDELNAQARAAFNLGGIVGPALVGLVFIKAFPNGGHWLVAGVFAAAAVIYQFIPSTSAAAGPAAAPSLPGIETYRRFLCDRWQRIALAVSVLLALPPALRALIPTAFADLILHSTKYSAWLTLAFGLGGSIGAFAYKRLHGSFDGSGWLKWGGAGAAAMALGLMTRSFASMFAAIFAYAMLNELAYVSLTTDIQRRAPQGSEADAMGLLRFSANGTSMLARLLIGLVFTAAAAPGQALALIGGGMAAAGAAVLWSSSRLREAAVPEEAPEGGQARGMAAIEASDL
jgi:hypothetical protein